MAPPKFDKSLLQNGDPRKVFELGGSLGEGSYGAVFRATYLDEARAGEEVAVKVIPVDDDMLELQKEIEILRDTGDEFIVQYVGSYHDVVEDHIWIVMELCIAGSVNDLIHICGIHLEEEQIRIICASVLLGLTYLHSNKMIHRDIKAGNILLTEDGVAKLADFGVSAQLEEETKRKTVIGTPFWMAPEVISESSYDGKADVWSLGITVIEMAEMEPPYSNIHPMRAIFMIPSRPPPKFAHPEEWSPELNDFLSLCLQKNPDERPNAEELMSHDFVKDAVQRLDKGEPRGRSQELRELVDGHIEEIDAARKEEAEGRLSSSGTSSAGTRGNTARYVDTARSSTHNGYAGGGGGDTMEQTLNTGTMLTSGKGTSIFTPGEGSSTAKKEAPFMAYFQSKTVKLKRRDSAAANNTLVIPQDSAEMLHLSSRLNQLDTQYSLDIGRLREAYAKRRDALLAAASAVE